jgi:hypothetical protein
LAYIGVIASLASIISRARYGVVSIFVKGVKVTASIADFH